MLFNEYKMCLCFSGIKLVCLRFAVPPDHQAQGLVGALHQADGLLPGAAEGDGVDAHHLVPGQETDGCCRAALLHLHSHPETSGASEVSHRVEQVLSLTQQDNKPSWIFHFRCDFIHILQENLWCTATRAL